MENLSKDPNNIKKIDEEKQQDQQQQPLIGDELIEELKKNERKPTSQVKRERRGPKNGFDDWSVSWP